VSNNKCGLYFVDQFNEWLKISDISFERFEKELIEKSNDSRFYKTAHACELEYKNYNHNNNMHDLADLDVSNGELIYTDGYKEIKFKYIDDLK
jgi:hypothetical protein